MTWDEGMGSIVTGAIGLGVGLAVAGKIIRDITDVKNLEDGSRSKSKPSWWL